MTSDLRGWQPNSNRMQRLLAPFLAILALATLRAAETPSHESILPLLESHCIKCHGPKKQKGNLRLDSRASALRGGDDGPAITPEKPLESPLLRRITSTDPESRMPPEGDRLPPASIKILQDWIAAGAHWPESDSERQKTNQTLNHWSVQPVPTAFPNNTSIDSLIEKSLARQNLSPSPVADRRTLIRRLTFDLHGLPPTPNRVDQFIHDPDPLAYEKLVDELLASPHYGERWARHWLDIAHYADTHGFERDQIRPNAWRYRDYVIDSLNNDKPYDRFLREQIAGDILAPGDTPSVIATGFLAAGPWDFVGHVETKSDMLRRSARAGDLDDIVTQVFTASLGLTVNCARCHDHKLDPISQREYYSLWSIFAGVKRGERDTNLEHAKRNETQRQTLQRDLDATRAELARVQGEGLDLADIVGGGNGRGSGRKGFGIDPRNGTFTKEKLNYHRDIPPNRPQRIEWPADLKNPPHALQSVFIPDGRFPLKLSPASETKGLPATSGHAWDALRNGPLNAQRSTTLNGIDYASTGHSLLGMHANSGATFDLNTLRDALGKKALRLNGTIGFGADPGAAQTRADFTVVLDEKIVFQRVGLRKNETAPLDIAIPPDAQQLSLIATDGGDGIGNDLLFIGDPRINPDEPTASLSPADLAHRNSLREKSHRLDKQIRALPAAEKVYAITTEPTPAPIKIQRRGNPEDQTEEVAPGALAWLRHSPPILGDNALPEGERRRALAEWITSPANPLTRRVIVNRLWHHHFGAGIVSTPSDFGLGGDRPSHPELLDWLADQLLKNQWSLKSIHRLILLSHTYRQLSDTDSTHANAPALDAQNRLLWRQNPRRLDAESIRDAILSVCGSLNTAKGGPGFRDFKYTEAYAPIYEYITPDSPDLFRRSIYRFIVRTTPHRLMTTLDCPDPANLTPARVQTTTPLQALTMSNNPFILKQSAHLANQISSAQPSLETQVHHAFRAILQRPPTPAESLAASRAVEQTSLAELCRTLLNTNEFVYID